MSNLNEKYLTWLHEITVLGYDKKIVIPAQDGGLMEEYFKQGKTPKQALETYQQTPEKMRALIIDGLIQEKIERLVEYAALHPYSMDDILDVMNGAKSPGDSDPNFVVNIPTGYKICYTEELQPAGRVRHLSISVDTPGRMPSEESVEFIMGLIGFKNPLRKCKLAIEEIGENHQAINVLEVKQ